MPSSEFSLIARHFSSLGRGPAVRLGVGDDCAILDVPPDHSLVTSVDTLVANVHFPQDAFPEDIGYRAVAVAASDLAAMGASPLAATLAITLPEADDFWLHAFSEGLALAISEYGLPLIGGDTTKGPLSITITVYGSVLQNRALLRSGAKPGEIVCVSGTLGDAAAGLACVQDRWSTNAEHAQFLIERFYRPTARIQLGQSLLDTATSAIDISDGLLVDAGHIAAASGVCIHFEQALLPLSPALLSCADSGQVLNWAVSGGDDYELCFTLPSNANVPNGCTRVGKVGAGSGVQCDFDVDITAGYRHF